MDLSKVEAGMLDVELEEIRIHNIVGNIKKLFDPIASSKNILFEALCDTDIPEYLISDGNRLEQILKNFLSNAFKFTNAEGSVCLNIQLPGDKVKYHNKKLAQNTAICFSVTDTGIGIPEEKQQAIFEAFQQEDGSTNRKYGGTGLGLTISRELARLLGGEIQLTSEKGKGSTFSVYLPLKLENVSNGNGQNLSELPPKLHSHSTLETNPKPSALEKSMLGKTFIPDDRNNIQNGDRTLLIIDDDPEFAKILVRIARKNNFQCLVAGDGRSGLYLALEYLPTGVILDMGLPDIQGEEVIDQLKFNLQTRYIPVHVISAADHKHYSLNRGAVGFLSKPASENDIVDALSSIIRVGSGDLKHLLIIEDNKPSQRAISCLFDSKSVSVDFARTGKEGCEKLLTMQYDCAILDLGLPDMSGLDVLERVTKVTKETKEKLPPVIVYTGREITDDENKRLMKFTNNIIIKGVESPEHLVDDVTLFLHNVESSLPLEHQQKIRMIHDADAMLKGRNILLVDDDMRNTYALSKQLRGVGLNVVMADDGQLALEKVQSNDFELIIMDIMMPVMDGYEAMREIRKMKTYAEIPIIALTAKAMGEDRGKCIEAGASEYLSKPVDVDKLLSMLKVWLYKRV